MYRCRESQSAEVDIRLALGSVVKGHLSEVLSRKRGWSQSMVKGLYVGMNAPCESPLSGVR
jgi:hypothetical protein